MYECKKCHVEQAVADPCWSCGGPVSYFDSYKYMRRITPWSSPHHYRPLEPESELDIDEYGGLVYDDNLPEVMTLLGD